MNKMVVNSPEETIEIARNLGSGLAPGSLLTLEGELAAGKTTFTKGIALGLGIEEVVDSPTFAIIKEYGGEIPLYHIDVYRLDGDSDIDFVLEYLDRRDGVCVIEWASMIEQDLPVKRIDVKIERLDGDAREITVKRR